MDRPFGPALTSAICAFDNQSKLAAAAGISHSTFTHVKNGGRLGVDVAIRIARAHPKHKWWEYVEETLAEEETAAAVGT